MVRVIFFIPPYDAFCGGEHIPVENRDSDALLQLPFVVQEAGPGLGEEEENSRHVGEDHEGHEEVSQVRKVLTAAAMTYVAAAASSILQLLRLVFLAHSRDD